MKLELLLLGHEVDFPDLDAVEGVSRHDPVILGYLDSSDCKLVSLHCPKHLFNLGSLLVSQFVSVLMDLIRMEAQENFEDGSGCF